MEIKTTEPEIQRRFFTSGKGDTAVAILLLLLFMILGPLLIEIITGNNGEVLSRFAGEAVVYAVLLYGLMRFAFKPLKKYNQILVFALVYIILYIAFLIFNLMGIS